MPDLDIWRESPGLNIFNLYSIRLDGRIQGFGSLSRARIAIEEPFIYVNVSFL